MTVDLDKTYWIGLLVSVILPVIVGLITTRVTHAGMKAIALLAMSTVTGFVTEYAGPHGDDYSVQTAVVLALVSFGTGVLIHFGLWKPAGVSAKAQDAFAKAA